MRLLFLLFTILGLSCTENSASAQNKIAPDTFESMLKSDSTIQLVDVRTPQEYQNGHIAGAKNLNIHDPDFAQRISQLDKDRPVLVYCAVGGRSANAAGQCSKMGFTKVFDLKGGITAWKEKGKAMKN